MTFATEDAWYASATFWAAAGVLATVSVGVIAAVVTWKVVFYKRRLLYGIAVNAPILAAAAAGPDLEVRYRGTPLVHPRVMELQLITRSRKDIPSADYDAGQPIQLDVGVPIIRLLKVSTHPSSPVCPAVTAVGSTLQVGPGLLGKRQRHTFTLLVDGVDPSVTCHSPLINVEPPKYAEPDSPSFMISLVTNPEKLAVLTAIIAMVASVAVAVISASIQR